MKTLYLVRHAKSSWEFDLDDHERPLNERGLNDAPKVAQKVAQLIDLPQLWLSSDAMRAKTTAVFFAQAFDIPDSKIELRPKLYDFSGQAVVDIICSVDDSVDTLIVFGHNNAMTSIVNFYGNKKIDNVPTCGFTAITFDIERWQDLEKGKTIHTIIPKQL